MTDSAASSPTRRCSKSAASPSSSPACAALAGVSLTLGRGEVLAVIGENGAGKSTLMKILAGVQTPDAGEIRLDGRPVEIDSVAGAR